MRGYLLGILALAACSGGSSAVLTGRVATGFPAPVTGVKVLRGTTVVATSPVAADGTFRIEVPAGSGLTLRLVGTGHDNVMFPRRTGVIDHTFTARSGAELALGAVHFVGNASTTTFTFDHGSSASGCDEDDHDQNGAICVDDGEDDDGGTCTGSGSGSGTGSGSGSGSGTTVGLVVPDDGGGSGSGMSSDDGMDDGDAVCDHDVPEACGSDDGSDDDGSDGSDGSGS